jgi:hypothetical protein
VLKEGVSGEDGVVWLNDGCRDLRGWVDGESEFGLLAVIDRESLEEEGSETRTGTTSDGLEDEESLETSALIGELSDSIKTEVNNLLTDGVVTTGEVIGGILLTRDELLGMEKLSVGAGSDLIDDSWLEIKEDGARDVLASTSLGEECVESVVAATDSLIRRHLSVRLDSVLEAEELPAGVAALEAGLADVKADALTHGCLGGW